MHARSHGPGSDGADDPGHDLGVVLRRRQGLTDGATATQTTARSATAMTWSMLCEIRITATPSSFRRRTRSSTRADSRSPSAAVGSSRMTSFEENATARATATAWRWPPDMSATGASRSGRWICSRSSSSRVRSDIVRCRMTRRPRGSHAGPASSRPAKKLAAGGEVVEEREVLVDGLDPVRAHRHRVGRRDVDSVEGDRPGSRAGGHR